MTTTAYRTCPICDAICGLRLTLDGDRVTSVTGDEADPLSRGFICPKGASLGAIDADPDRLRTPLIREGDDWREASWDEAFAAVEAGLSGVIERHGRQALAAYFGNPTFHTMAGFLYRQPLSESLGTRHIYSVSTIDQMPKQVACGLMLGDPMAIAVPDLDRTDHLVVIGANPLESNGSLCSAPDFPRRLRALRRRGGRLVVIDPRRTRTAKAADEHHAILPGTDAALLLAVVHVLLAEELTTIGVDVTGLDELRALARDFAPDAVAEHCGIDADAITRLARDLAAAPTAAVYARTGTCTAEFGTVTQWLVDVVNILTGNFDSQGGVLFTRTAHAEIFRAPEPYQQGRWHSRVKGMPETMGELPVATLADEIETPGEGQPRALLMIAGNPVLSAPNGPRIGRALPNLEFMVAVDPYLNETTRHANVVMPPPRITQSPHYDFLEQIVAVRNYTRFSPAAVPLASDQRSEAEIMARLTLIVAGAGAAADPAQLDEQIIEQVLTALTQLPGSGVSGQDPAAVQAGLDGADGPERFLDALLKAGPYGLSLAALRAEPHGIDLGALEPRVKELIRTQSGRIELAPAELADDVARLRSGLVRRPAEMLLIGRRQLRSNNSWLHNVEPLRGGSNRCTLLVHPADADRLGLAERAVIRSAAGEVEVAVEHSDTIRQGVVSLPHGWGHTGGRQRVATTDAGVNANALTDESVVDVLSGTAVFNGVPVTVRPATS
ncbi:molybdopterin-dependent oxidoreductase [Haloechinothrix halophila]|uniref:molybdopterin-dependent oxidoreductase n=1 Tax=Haloechinothrix halophila TaxID=1069073 RepID=UPI000421CC56|nr:molybdopterin-dependent oxidoreductase [Haloechinothrix halophila]